MKLYRSLFLSIVLIFYYAVSSYAQGQILSIQDVAKLDYGTPVYGYSTLNLSGPQKFTGKYWGVLNNVIGPSHDWIVVELDGGYFKNSGVIAGQSGSPVFVKVKGKEYKIGTVSYANGFSKNPIAYLTPIKEVLDSAYDQVSHNNIANHAVLLKEVKTILFKNNLDELLMNGTVSMGVKSPASKHFNQTDYIKEVKPGSVLGVQLAWGDFDFTGAGTVSHVDGNRIFMFGHPFLQLGPVEYRLVPARVLGVQASTYASYIVATPVEDVGALGIINQDRETGISGFLGMGPENSIPVEINLVTSNGVTKKFNFNTISDSWAGPILVGLGTVYSVGSWSRAFGNTTLFMNGKIEVDSEVVEFNQAFMNSEFFRGDFSGAIESLFVFMRDKVSLILTNSYSKAKVKKVTVNVKVFDQVRTLNIDNVIIDSPTLKQGDKINLKISLSQPREEPKMVSLPIDIPGDLSDGLGRIVVGNAATIDRLEAENTRVVNLATLIRSLNQKRKVDAIYVYVVYPLSRVSGEDNVGQQNPDSPRKISKRVFSNIEEYEIDTSNFIVGGERTLEFKVGLLGTNNNSH